MEDLYPGRSCNGDFAVPGAVRIFKAGTTVPLTSPRLTEVQVGFDRDDPRSLRIGPGGEAGYPAFAFRLLTLDFLAAAMDTRRAGFTFSLLHEAIGSVAYVSSAAARDYGWQLAQAILSANVRGQSSGEGMMLALAGDLANPDPGGADPMPEQYRHASYSIELAIPWDVMRFLFYDHADLIQAKFLQAMRSKSEVGSKITGDR